MDSVLVEVFEQAEQLLAEVDRRAAEEQDRRTAAERQVKLDAFGAEVEQAFDFSSREKIELNTRLDLHHGEPSLEFMVRTARAVFALTRTETAPQMWRLMVQEGTDRATELGTYPGGAAALPSHQDGSRRIAAVRIVAAIGAWLRAHGGLDRNPAHTPAAAFAQQVAEGIANRHHPDEAQKQIREPAPHQAPNDPPPSRPNREVTYGTFGKFMGY